MRNRVGDLVVGDIVEIHGGMFLLVSQEFMSDHVGGRWLDLQEGKVIGTYNRCDATIPETWIVIPTPLRNREKEQRR